MDPKKIKLDPEEQWIEDHLEEFVPASPATRAHVKRAIEKARKEKMISLRLHGPDLYELKQLAHNEGMPYQTFISSILYKYITRQLIDRKEVKKMLELMKR